MPNTIPNWDQARVLLGYLTSRQLRHEPTTLRQLSSRMGVGAARIFEVLESVQVTYHLIYLSADRTRADTEIFLVELPADVRRIYKVPAQAWQASVKFFQERAATLQPLAQIKQAERRRAQRKELERKKLRYFLADNPLETP